MGAIPVIAGTLSAKADTSVCCQHEQREFSVFALTDEVNKKATQSLHADNRSCQLQ